MLSIRREPTSHSDRLERHGHCGVGRQTISDAGCPGTADAFAAGASAAVCHRQPLPSSCFTLSSLLVPQSCCSRIWGEWRSRLLYLHLHTSMCELYFSLLLSNCPPCPCAVLPWCLPCPPCCSVLPPLLLCHRTVLSLPCSADVFTFLLSLHCPYLSRFFPDSLATMLGQQQQHESGRIGRI